MSITRYHDIAVVYDSAMLLACLFLPLPPRGYAAIAMLNIMSTRVITLRY